MKYNIVIPVAAYYNNGEWVVTVGASDIKVKMGRANVELVVSKFNLDRGVNTVELEFDRREAVIASESPDSKFSTLISPISSGQALILWKGGEPLSMAAILRCPDHPEVEGECYHLQRAA